LMVHPSYRLRGIGSELLRQAEEMLATRGAQQVVFGSMWPACPYLFGIYGGSNSPGILSGNIDAVPFLTRRGFRPDRTMIVYHRRLDTPLTIADTRFGILRRRYEAQIVKHATIPSWWHDCQWSSIEPTEMRLVDKLTGLPAARAICWDLEGFSWRWNAPSVGVLDFQVRDDLRRLGLGKLLMANLLRQLQDQFFAIAELQIPSDRPAAHEFARALGFEEIDRGRTYLRDRESSSHGDLASATA